MGEPFRIVHVLVACQAAVDRLPDQAGEWELRVLAPRIGDVLRDQITLGIGLRPVIVARKPASIRTFDASLKSSEHNQIGNPGIMVS